LLVQAAPDLALAVRVTEATDWPAVQAIYAEGIATRQATFETEVPSWTEWDAAHLCDHRLVAEVDGEVVGWAALSPVSRRPCYAGVTEGSVYVSAARRGQGVGSSLLHALVEGAARAGIWTIQTSIFPENVASIALHRRAGFRVVGTRERIGQLGGTWRDTVLLERRRP
jgi:L-amino acid N-acyltransferase YncA